MAGLTAIPAAAGHPAAPFIVREEADGDDGEDQDEGGDFHRGYGQVDRNPGPPRGDRDSMIPPYCSGPISMQRQCPTQPALCAGWVGKLDANILGRIDRRRPRADYWRPTTITVKLPGTMVGRGRGFSGVAAGRGPNSAVTR